MASRGTIAEVQVRSSRQGGPLGAVSLTASRLWRAQLSPGGATSAHKRLPLGQSNRAMDLVSLTIDEVAFLVEDPMGVVVHAGMD